MFGGVFGQRAKENINRHFGLAFLARAEPEAPVLDGEVLLGRVEVNRIGLQRLPVLRVQDRNLRAAGQQFVHQAFEVRRQVLDDDIGDLAGKGRALKELLNGVQSSG